MTTIWERVESALTPLGIPFAAGSYKVSSGQNYPDTYIVYIVFSFDPAQYADDEEVERIEAVQISIYKRVSLNNLPDVIGAMKAADFMFIGGRELEPDLETNHLGIAFDFECQENL